MNITFKNFPHDFNIDNNFFSYLFSDEIFKKFESKNISIYGAYPNTRFISRLYAYLNSKISPRGIVSWQMLQNGFPSKIDQRNFNLWVTFENRRPLIKNFDATLSFDRDNFGGVNFYLPLIYLYLDLTEKQKYHANHNVSPKELTKRRNLDANILDKKNRFLTSFINNPHPIRLNAIEKFKQIDDVKLFGRYYNNYTSEKIAEAKKSWFCLCFENDLYPGYVTEKVLEAYLGYSIPLYWGDDVMGILNPKALINLKDFDNLDSYFDFVKNLYEDKQKMISIIEEPLFIKEFQISELTNFLYNRLELKFGGKLH